MTTKKLISKVSRYIVLSKEFEQDVDDLFEDRAEDVGTTTFGGSISVSGISVSGGSYDNSISMNNITIEAKTRAEVILEKAQAESNRSDRYDEYKKLQNKLSKYCDGFFEFRTK